MQGLQRIRTEKNASNALASNQRPSGGLRDGTPFWCRPPVPLPDQKSVRQNAQPHIQIDNKKING